MDDTGTRFPETKTILIGTNERVLTLEYSNTYFRGSRCQKVVNLLVDINGTGQILDTPDLGLNQMVAMHGGRNRGGVHAR